MAGKTIARHIPEKGARLGRQGLVQRRMMWLDRMEGEDSIALADAVGVGVENVGLYEDDE